VTNTTAVLPTLPTYLTMWSGGAAKPAVSNLNAVEGQVVANATMTNLWYGNKFNIYNDAGSTHVLVDAVGTMEYLPTMRPVASAQLKASSLTIRPGTAAAPPKWSSQGTGTPVRRTAG
jgi:hypothetical protein